jgi:hypothetical protein
VSSKRPIIRRFKSRKDVENFWRAVRDVPARTRRRSKRDEERYALGLYLFARATYELIDFPMTVEEDLDESRSPDFFVREGEVCSVGLEVTRATTQALQQKMTRAETSVGSDVTPIDLDDGLLARESEDLSHRQFEEAVKKKLAKFNKYRPAPSYDLLVYYDGSSLLWDRERTLDRLRQWLRNARTAAPLLGKVSVIISLDVIYDVDGECRTLPFVDLESPERFPDLGSRVEFAAQKAVRDELLRSGSR